MYANKFGVRRTSLLQGNVQQLAWRTITNTLLIIPGVPWNGVTYNCNYTSETVTCAAENSAATASDEAMNCLRIEHGLPIHGRMYSMHASTYVQCRKRRLSLLYVRVATAVATRLLACVAPLWLPSPLGCSPFVAMSWTKRLRPLWPRGTRFASESQVVQ